MFDKAAYFGLMAAKNTDPLGVHLRCPDLHSSKCMRSRFVPKKQRSYKAVNLECLFGYNYKIACAGGAYLYLSFAPDYFITHRIQPYPADEVHLSEDGRWVLVSNKFKLSVNKLPRHKYVSVHEHEAGKSRYSSTWLAGASFTTSGKESWRPYGILDVLKISGDRYQFLFCDGFVGEVTLLADGELSKYDEAFLRYDPDYSAGTGVATSLRGRLGIFFDGVEIFDSLHLREEFNYAGTNKVSL